MTSLERSALRLRLHSAAAVGTSRRAAPVRGHSLCTSTGHRSRSCAVSVTRSGGRWVAALTGLAVVVVCGRYGQLATAAAAVVYLLMRRAFIRRLDGITGDCAGAMMDVIEAVSLVTLASS